MCGYFYSVLYMTVHDFAIIQSWETINCNRKYIYFTNFPSHKASMLVVQVIQEMYVHSKWILKF